MEAEDDDGVFRPCVEHRTEGFLADQRRVGIEDNGLARFFRKQRRGLGDGMGGAELRVLDDGFDHLAVSRRGGGDGLAPVAGDGDDARRFQRLGGRKRVVEEGGGGDLVQDLGQVGVHPRALTGCQNDD